MKIEILGSGCPNCIRLEQNVKKALADVGKEAEVIKVTKIQDIMSYGIMSTPAIVIDGDIKSYGKVNSVDELKKLIE